MGKLHSVSKVSIATLLISQAFFTIPVFAAGYQINEISPSLEGDATAGAAAASNDVSAMFINPATLATLLRGQAYLGGSEIMPHVSMTNASAVHTVNVPGSPPSAITSPVLGSNSQNNISQSAFAPDGYFGYRFNNQLAAGLALTAPYGLTTHYEDTSVVRFGAQYSAVRSANIAPALAYNLNDQWAVGVGFQAQYLRATFSNFNGPYTIDPAINSFIAASNPTYLKADGWGYGYTLGLLYKPMPCARIGIGYRSQVSDSLTGYGQQYVSPGGTVPAPTPDFLFNAQTAANASVKTPAVLTLSAAQDIYNWTVKASAQLNFWNSFNQLSINMPQAFATNTTIATKWRNVWFGAVGADYRWENNWIFRGGLAYDQTPTVDAYRDPRIPDSDRVWLNLGATYMLNKHLSFDGAYAHIFMIDQNVNVTQASGTSVTSTLPLEVNQIYANYKGSADILALAVRYSF